MNDAGRQMIAHWIPLTADLTVRLWLPEDMTAIEAERLCGIIRALALPDAEQQP